VSGEDSDMRVEFEEWANKFGLDTEKGCLRIYKDETTLISWIAWIASSSSAKRRKEIDL